jgi:hypothetical protein
LDPAEKGSDTLPILGALKKGEIVEGGCLEDWMGDNLEVISKM